jgi:hypothetical protein
VKPFSLGQFVDGADDLEEAHVVLKVRAPMPPRLVENLRTLRRLDLLTDEVVMSLLAQAPIDPLGIYGAMKHMGAWAFSPHDFTMVQVLAKKGNKPVALMRIDLMSDDITFVALEKNQLVQTSVLEAHYLVEEMQRAGMTETNILRIIQDHMKGAVDTGLRNAGS